MRRHPQLIKDEAAEIPGEMHPDCLLELSPKPKEIRYCARSWWNEFGTCRMLGRMDVWFLARPSGCIVGRMLDNDEPSERTSALFVYIVVIPLVLAIPFEPAEDGDRIL